uniref:Uncharacterized protein n=1 Tax=Anopheles quadriannulatus TaxID=34691 RepID=A0A182XR61_ANOQN
MIWRFLTPRCAAMGFGNELQLLRESQTRQKAIAHSPPSCRLSLSNRSTERFRTHDAGEERTHRTDNSP